MTSKLYLHKVLNRLSLSQLRQLAREFKMDSSGSKSQLISRLIDPVQIGGTDPIGPIGPVGPISPVGPVDYWKIGGELEAILLRYFDHHTNKIDIPIEQINDVLRGEGVKYIYSPQEWFKILLPSKIINKSESPYEALAVFVNSLNVLPKLSYGELKILNSYYPTTLNISQEDLESKRQNDLAELKKWLAEYNINYSINALSNLNKLDFRGDPIRSLPDSIGVLSNLQWLYLTGTPLQSLPNSIGNLSSLKYLYLDNTLLNSLPDSIGALPELKHLYLSDNRLLQSLPDSIGNLSELYGLDLGTTPLQSLPESIGTLPNLKVLYLHGTPLESLPVVQKLRDRGVAVYT